MTATADSFVHPEFLVSTAWLAEHVDDTDVVVLDGTVHLRPNPPGPYTVVSGRADYEAGHIPGAQFVDLQADLSDNSQNLRFMTPTVAQFAASNGVETFALAPWALVIVPVASSGEQFVGLNAKPGRLMVTSIVRMSGGIPWITGGRGSLTAVICDV